MTFHIACLPVPVWLIVVPQCVPAKELKSFGLDCVRGTAEEECSRDRERGSVEKKNYWKQLKQLKQVKYLCVCVCVRVSE